MRTRRLKAGMTLTEVIVVLGISVLVTGGIWAVFVGSNRSFEGASAHIAATRSAIIATQWIRRDLDRIAVPRRKPGTGATPRPVRIVSGQEIEISVVPEIESGSLTRQLSELGLETVRYRFVPSGEPDAGFYRNGVRLSAIHLDRFEVALLADSSSGAPFVRLAVTGVDPAGRATVFHRDLVYLEALDRLQRNVSSMPNPYPSMPDLPGVGVGIL